MKKFTLLELLIVVAVIGILGSLLLPSLRKARLAAKTGVSISNLSQIHKGTMTYASMNNGWMCLAANNPHHSNDNPNWRVLIYEALVGEDLPSDQGPRKEVMANGTYRQIMWCPIILEHRGGYQSAHGEGRGHYAMNKFFGINRNSDSNSTDSSENAGYKHISFAALTNEKEPFLMPTRKSGNGAKNQSGHLLGGGDWGEDDDGKRGYPSYLYTQSRAIACMLDGSMSMKTAAWGSEMNSNLRNEYNFK